MRVLNAVRRWYRETGRGGGYVWFRVPGRGNSRGTQADPTEYQIPDFSNRDDFSPALYANLCVTAHSVQPRFRHRQFSFVGGSMRIGLLKS